MSDAPLPTGLALAAQLFDLGLAPPGCEEVPIYGTPRYWYRLDGGIWLPGSRIQDCWYLVERFGLSIILQRVRQAHGQRQAWWLVGEKGRPGVSVATFAEIPAAICNAALNIYAAQVFAEAEAVRAESRAARARLEEGP